jgi:hypothetical protein
MIPTSLLAMVGLNHHDLGRLPLMEGSKTQLSQTEI